MTQHVFWCALHIYQTMYVSRMNPTNKEMTGKKTLQQLWISLTINFSIPQYSESITKLTVRRESFCLRFKIRLPIFYIRHCLHVTLRET
jgi:hypothetical protein